MKHIQPVSVEQARSEALPLLLQGFNRRGQARTDRERSQRAAVKLERDDRHCTPPEICTL
ncbi:MAG: hypothetical protein KC613_23840 [Myxococcales bacterium]|nr:hypothetical protein [Myxococcales bacterium]